MGNRLFPESETTELRLMGEGRGLQKKLVVRYLEVSLAKDAISCRPLKLFWLRNFQTISKGLSFSSPPAPRFQPSFILLAAASVGPALRDDRRFWGVFTSQMGIQSSTPSLPGLASGSLVLWGLPFLDHSLAALATF